jgi:hypothetical protein
MAQLAEIAADPVVMRWIGNGQIWDLSKLEKTRKYVASVSRRPLALSKFIAWGIIVNSDLVGYLAITRMTAPTRCPEFDIRIFIGTQFQKKGYATLALTTLTKHVFPKSQCVKFTSYIKPANIASGRIHQKAGFTFLHNLIKKEYGNASFDKYIYESSKSKSKSSKSKSKKIN